MYLLPRVCSSTITIAKSWKWCDFRHFPGYIGVTFLRISYVLSRNLRFTHSSGFYRNIYIIHLSLVWRGKVLFSSSQWSLLQMTEESCRTYYSRYRLGLRCMWYELFDIDNIIRQPKFRIYRVRKFELILSTYF